MMLSAALTALLAISAQLPHVRTPQMLNGGAPGQPEPPVAAVEDRQAVVLWATEITTTRDEVWGAASDDGGATWTIPFRVDADPTGAAKSLDEDSVQVRDGVVLACWMDARNGLADAYFRSWPAGVPSSAAEVRLHDGYVNGQAQVSALRLRASADGQQLAVLMVVTPLGGQEEVVLLRSVDGGANFLLPTVLHAGGDVAGVDLVLDGNDLHIVWQDDTFGFGLHEIRYQVSHDGGQSWLPFPVTLTPGLPSDARGVDLDVAGARLAVGFGEVSAICGVSVVVSSDGGASWVGPRRVGSSLSPACVDRAPSVFHTFQDLVVTWSDDRAGSDKAFVAWSGDRGLSWTEQELHAAYGRDVQLVGDPGNGVFGAFWNGSAQAYASWSRGLTPDPRSAFTIGGLIGNSFITEVGLDHDPVYGDFLCSWRTLTTLNQSYDVWVAGFRNAQVEPLGPFTPGSQNAFLTDGFPETEAGDFAQVLVALGPGNAALPANDGRTAGLASDAYLSATAFSPAFRGQLTAAGIAATGPVVLPLTVPPGTVLHYAAVSFATGPLRFGSLSEVATVTVQ